MKKKPYKSKTINSALVIILITIMSLMGIGEKEIVKTYDSISNTTGEKSENIKDLITMFAGFGVVYGRYKAKDV